jgi:5'-nucleotidase
MGPEGRFGAVENNDGKIVTDKDPMGRQHFRFTVIPLSEPESGTDRWAIERGEISITPLRLDLTDDQALELLEQRARAN